MTNRTYAELLDRIEALAGKDSFTSNEQTRILSLANARLYAAYRRSDYWPRYLTIGEARFVTDNTVPFAQESAVIVADAGTTDANGVYQPLVTQVSGSRKWYLNGDITSYYISEISGEFTLYPPSGLSLYQSDAGAEPWSVTWSLSSGTAPAPTSTQGTRANVDTFLRLYSGVVYGPNENGYELDMFVDNDGAHPTNTSTEWDQLYCTYKKVWDGPYLANSTAIPQEFFEFTAVGVLSDWMRSNGNFSDARFAAAEADELLNAELVSKQVQYNAQVYAPRYNTYISRQSRNY